MGTAGDDVRAATFTTPAGRPPQLTGRFPRWAARKLVPKVLVANQTRILEAVADRSRRVAAGRSGQHRDARPIGAVAGRDRSGADLAGGIGRWRGNWRRAPACRRRVRVGPALLAELPWPAGDLTRLPPRSPTEMSRAAAGGHRRLRARPARRAAAGVVAVAVAGSCVTRPAFTCASSPDDE